MDLLSDRLKRLECPFNWNLEQELTQRRGDLKDRLLDKIETDKDTEYNEDSWTPNGSSAWQKCSQFLTIAWQQERGDSEGEKFLTAMEKFVKNAKTKIPFIERHFIVVEYLIKAMWAHVYNGKNELEKAQEYLESITHTFEEMKDSEKAALKALKSCVFMEFGPVGCGRALENINEALELESEEAEWHFLKGKCLSRERRARNHKSCPSDEELHHLRKAVTIGQNNCATHLVFYAFSLRESALSPVARFDSTRQNELLTECEDMMRRAKLLSYDSAIVCSRIAKGLMPVKNATVADLVKQCVLRSVELLPKSGLVNHVAGNYYMYRELDVEKAISHLQIAAFEKEIFGAYVNLIELKWKRSSENIDPLMTTFWKTFRNDAYNETKALPIMASYYFFVKNNLKEAISYWRRWMQTGTNFYESSVFVKCTDMTKTLLGQIRCELESNSTLSTDDETLFNSFVADALEARPNLDIARITANREKVIRFTLGEFDQDIRRVVEPKLPLSTLRNRPNKGHRQPPRRVERVLPHDWRQH